MFEKEMESQENMNDFKTDDNIPAAMTDIGCERDINEDRYAVVDCPSGQAWIVCDGMGGVVGGELAAQLAIDTIRRALENGDYENSSSAINVAIEEANRIILLRRQNPAFGSMGTTVVAAMFCDEEVTICHAGDSRAYVLRGSEIKQITVDHTYVQDLLERGEITADQVQDHPQAHVLTRCLGAAPRLQIDNKKFWIWPLTENEKEDKLILCSDGLYSHVDDAEIADICSNSSPQEACVKLVELAKARGGYDNITISILPLKGHLREEEFVVDPVVKQKRKKAIRSKKEAAEAMPPIKKAILFLMIFGLGAVITTLLVMLQLTK